MRNNILAVALLFASLQLPAQIQLPKLISDGMVLQRDTRIALWGQASKREHITVEFRGKRYNTTASAAGEWKLELEPMSAGGPYNMILSGKNKITIKDILIGDVWFCSGQSNMVHQMNIHDVTYADEIANANNPEIRQFWIPTLTDLKGPDGELPEGGWKSAIGEDVRPFSAVAYFFARKVYEKHHVPIGLINASVGGTPIEAWISEEGLKGFPELLKTIIKNKDTAYINAVNKKALAGRDAQKGVKDRGSTEPVPWHTAEYAPKEWRTINIPGYWEDQGAKDLDGVVWYRKEINLPAHMAGKPAKVFLGRIVDADVLYINGRQVGNTTYRYPQRRYSVPAGLLKGGKNIFAVRVANFRGKGGFVPDKPYYLFAGNDTIDLKGYWQYKVGEVFAPGPPAPPGISAQNQPTALYNAMVAPVVPYPIKGILWYQGESNAGRTQEYADLLPALIRDWRGKFRAPELPFIYAQLPNYMEVDYLPSESHWASLRESQLKALQLPHTAMTVNIDLGEWNDIHPDNKKDVGERMALAAQKMAYGDRIVYSGPIYSSHKIDGDRVIISFTHTGSGLVTDDGEKLSEFAIAGEDKRFVWAHAKIEGDKVVVWNEDVPAPKYVRYAWADNPDNPNLYNREGLPASPFRNYDPDTLNDLPWQGKRAAVVLTYDDALDVHLDNVVPFLDSLGLRATFYVSAHASAFRTRIDEWRKISENGHELGNHTLFHPCDGQKPNRPWINPNYDMHTYSVRRMVDEIKINNTILEAIDGKTNRTFAFPCGDMKVGGDKPFIGELKSDLVAARAVRSEMHKIGGIDVYNMDSYPINGESGNELIDMVQKAVDSNSLLVFLFHGVGGGHSMNVSLTAHHRLLEYLKHHENEVWTTTLIDAVKNINQYRPPTK